MRRSFDGQVHTDQRRFKLIISFHEAESYAYS